MAPLLTKERRFRQLSADQSGVECVVSVSVYQRLAALPDLTTASDHLPVVADYTIPLPPSLRLVNGFLSPTAGFQFAVSNCDGTAITSGQQARIAIYAATNPVLAFTNWTALTNATVLTNRLLRVNDTNSARYPQRYYRAVETP